MWSYHLGPQKLIELGVALGRPFPERGMSPQATFFQFGLVPALRAVLRDRVVSSSRSEVALHHVAVTWARSPVVDDAIGGSVDVAEENGAFRAEGECTAAGSPLCTFSLLLGPHEVAAPTVPENEPVARMTCDAARGLAFAAATWDLNPAYWSERFARAAGLSGLVVPPGLPAAWLVDLAEQGRGPCSSMRIDFFRAARVGEVLSAYRSYPEGSLMAVANAFPSVAATFVSGEEPGGPSNL
ncbi:MAG: N-terminal half of MaoC dehydratase [Actinomycetota bacterium]|nr:N-terminal half of MaoC dehydratase [Actinomycetota bacterium]